MQSADGRLQPAPGVLRCGLLVCRLPRSEDADDHSAIDLLAMADAAVCGSLTNELRLQGQESIRAS